MLSLRVLTSRSDHIGYAEKENEQQLRAERAIKSFDDRKGHFKRER